MFVTGFVKIEKPRLNLSPRKSGERLRTTKNRFVKLMETVTGPAYRLARVGMESMTGIGNRSVGTGLAVLAALTLTQPLPQPAATGAIPPAAHSGLVPRALVQAQPAPSTPAPPWSGEDGASGHPLMTASAIREAAANFENCVASMWPDAARRNITRASFERFTAALTPDLRIMDLMDSQPEFTKAIWDYLDRSEERR